MEEAKRQQSEYESMDNQKGRRRLAWGRRR